MSDTQQPAKQQRRWLRYSLRTFLLAITVGCVALGYWTHRANQQRAAREWVIANGGTTLLRL